MTYGAKLTPADQQKLIAYLNGLANLKSTGQSEKRPPTVHSPSIDRNTLPKHSCLEATTRSGRAMDMFC